MYFIDPDLIKNKNYYVEQLNKMAETYGVELKLFYGKELFEYFNKSKIWNDLIEWLSKWKENLPELPEINFDKEPERSFEAIKNLEIRFWRKILENEKLWKEGIMKALFPEGKTLKILLNLFNSQDKHYKNLANLFNKKLKKNF